MNCSVKFLSPIVTRGRPAPGSPLEAVLWVVVVRSPGTTPQPPTPSPLSPAIRARTRARRRGPGRCIGSIVVQARSESRRAPGAAMGRRLELVAQLEQGARGAQCQRDQP